MKKSRIKEDQIVRALSDIDAKRKTVAQLSRELGVTEGTIYKWKQKYGGLNVNELRELKELRSENSKLKRMVADLMLEKEAIEGVLKKL